MTTSLRRRVVRLTQAVILAAPLLSAGCIGGPSGSWLGTNWSDNDLADEREFQDEVLKSGFPKASSVGLGDARTN
jgi:hypothetical protein